MGNTKLRRLFKGETEYREKNTFKHHHEYNEEYILELITPKGKVSYYHINKCNKCNSFKSIAEDHNISGFIKELNDEYINLPKLIGYKKSEWLIGFKDINEVKIMEIKELDRIKTKDGRIGTVMLILTAPDNTIGLEVEFDDVAPETETIDIEDVIEIIKED